MSRLTLESLKKMREEKKKEFSRKDGGKTIEILVGMGTCGIAAGAREAFDVLVNELKTAGLTDAVVKQCGCLGQCSAEPLVEVHSPGMPDILYGNVDALTAREIVRQHVLKGRLVENHVYDKPSEDLIKQ